MGQKNWDESGLSALFSGDVKDNICKSENCL